MYSLTKATTELVEHYTGALARAETDIVKWYITMKIRHSYGVLDAMRRIIQADPILSNMSREEKRVMELSALRHDDGRFYQNDGKKILSNKEFNHGAKSYETLKEAGYTDLALLFAVKYHDKIDISGVYEEEGYRYATNEGQRRIIMHCNACRDADKLQNLEYGFFDFDESKELDYSEELIEDLLASRVVDYSYKKTYIDDYLSMLGWFFDINYEGTKKILKNLDIEKSIINMLNKTSIDKEKISQIMENIKKSIN